MSNCLNIKIVAEYTDRMSSVKKIIDLKKAIWNVKVYLSNTLQTCHQHICRVSAHYCFMFFV